MLFKLLLFFFFLFIPLKLYPEQTQDTPLITVTPQAYTKTIVRIPNISGDQKGELSSLLRSIINLHLFTVALEEPPLPGFKGREYLLQGNFIFREGLYLFRGELIFTDENKSKNITIEANSKELLIYTLADHIIEGISPYRGLGKTRVAFVKRERAGDHLYVMDFSKKNLKRIKSAELILFPKFSPSGRKLAFLAYDGKDFNLEVADLNRGEHRIFKITGLSSAPVWMPNEKELILTLGRDGEINIYLFHLERAELLPLTTGRGVHQAGSISPDGKLLAFVGDRSGKPHIYIKNLETKKIERISAEGNYHTSPRFSPQNGVLVYLSQRAGKNELIIYNYIKKEKKRVVLPYSINDPAFSPTGDYLLFTSKSRNGTGLYILHLDSLLIHPYISSGNLLYPDWGRLS